jgi:hypothetical protein
VRDRSAERARQTAPARSFREGPLPHTEEPVVAASPLLEPSPLLAPASADSPLAGSLLLLNLALHLGIYGDFTLPRDLGPGLDPFDFVQLLAARLDPRARRPDRLWRLLAELAGRAPGQRPGRGFRAPEAWRVPVAWIEPFGFAGPWPFAVAGERLSARHPAGFAVIDVPLRRPREDARAARRRWLDHLAAYAAARLDLALGEPRAARLAIRLPGRVEATEARLDVMFALADLPIAIRRAGLDRTPGWIPACRRHVAFHFA